MSLRSRIALAGLIAAGPLFAQEVPIPVPPPAQAADQANVPREARVKQEGFLEPKINGERLAELYTELTGRRVTVSNAAIAAEFRFVQQGPITYGEAAELLKIAAVMEGFVFIPSGENHDKLVAAPAGQTGPQNKDLPVYTDATELPEGDQVVTYVMRLSHIKPDELVRTFTQVVGQFSSFGSIAAVPNASAVIITENTSLIRRLIELQETIDVPSTNVSTKFVKVQFADVTELADTLNQLVSSQQQQQTTAGVQRVQQTPQGAPPGAVPGVPGGGADSGGAGEQVPIQIVPDARTNRIFAMGRPIDIVFIEGLIREFDSPTSDKNFLRRKLRFIPVNEFIAVAEQALIRSSSGLAGGATAGGAAGGRPTGANFGGGGGGGQNNRFGGASTGNRGGRGGFQSNQFGGGGFGGQQTGGFGGVGGVSTGGSGGLIADRQGSTAPQAQVVGRTLLVADNITNSLVAQGPPSSIEILTQLLDEIDVKPEQVMISCVFGQLALGDDFNFGVDYLRTVEARGNNRIGGRGGSGAGPLIPLSDSGVFNPGNLPLTSVGRGLGVYGRIGEYLNVYLEALQSTSRFQVLSRPTVFMANNQRGRITSGTQIAVPTGSYSGNVSGGVTTNYEFRDVALTLEVVPLVNSETEVTLEIYLVSQDLGAERDVGQDFTIPDIINRELVTTVTVPNNETIVLGGLITTRDRKTKTGIPILSQIPMVGGLFGSDSSTKDREELLIFIQPSIVKDSSDLYNANADMEGRYKIDDLGRSFIDGPGVLPSNEAVNQPIQETKAGKGNAAAPIPASEESGGARRATSRPRGFINRR